MKAHLDKLKQASADFQMIKKLRRCGDPESFQKVPPLFGGGQLFPSTTSTGLQPSLKPSKKADASKKQVISLQKGKAGKNLKAKQISSQKGNKKVVQQFVTANSQKLQNQDLVDGIEITDEQDYVIDDELEDIAEIGMEMEDDQEIDEIGEIDDGDNLYDEGFAPIQDDLEE